MKSVLKTGLHSIGLSRTVHRLRNADALTVVMFHRVLPAEDPRFAGANPTYTVTPDELAQCIRLFKRFYSIVSLQDIRLARIGQKALPACPLLVTFDDGWQDNWQYAAPVLASHNVPWLLFVATGHIGSEAGFWQEEVFDAVLRGRTEVEPTQQGATALLSDLNVLEEAQRRARVAAIAATAGLPRRMAGRADLKALRDAGVALGGHGHSHEPMTTVDDPAGEFADCFRQLQSLDPDALFFALSFPHGRYDARLLREAHTAGFDLLFTSDRQLTPVTMLSQAPSLGRIDIDLRPYRRPDNKIDEAALAFSLITQPHVVNLSRASLQ